MPNLKRRRLLALAKIEDVDDKTIRYRFYDAAGATDETVVSMLIDREKLPDMIQQELAVVAGGGRGKPY